MKNGRDFYKNHDSFESIFLFIFLIEFYKEF